MKKVILTSLLFLSCYQQTRVLFCDHRQDDTEAFQAWLDGDRVYYPDGSQVGSRIRAEAFIISNTLYFRGTANKLVTNCYFEFKNMYYRVKYYGHYPQNWTNNVECDKNTECTMTYQNWQSKHYRPY